MSPPYGRARRFVHVACAAALALGAGGATVPAQPPMPSTAEPGDVHILALGDSLTAGFGLSRHQGFVPQLEAYLRRQGIRAHIVNAGVSGDTAAQGRQRLAWTLDDQSDKPRLAIVALGANDMLRGLPPSETRAELDAILTDLRRRGIRALLAGMVASPNLGAEFAREFNAIYPALAERHDALLQPFFLEGVANERTLNQPDGLHPNFGGVKRMVLAIAPRVIEALER